MKIVQRINDMKSARDNDPEFVKFRVKCDDGKFEEIVTYNKVLDHIKQQQDDDEKFWRFKSILNHKSPISQKSPEYKGSKVNLLIKWEDGSRTYEPWTSLPRIILSAVRSMPRRRGYWTSPAGRDSRRLQGKRRS